MLKERRNQAARLLVCNAAAEAALLDDEISAREEGLEDGVKRLSITIPADKVQKAWQKAVRLEGRTHDFPGFRQGKKASIDMHMYDRT